MARALSGLLGAAPYRLLTTIFPPAHSFCGVRRDSIIGPLVGALFVGLPVATDVWCRRGESDPRRHQKQTALSRLIDDDAPTAPAHGVFLARRGLGRRCLTDTSALGPWPTGDASQTSAVGRARRCEAPHVTGIPP